MRPVLCALLSRARRCTRLAAAFLVVAAALLTPAAPAVASGGAAPALERSETPFTSSSWQSDVTQSLVKLKVPMPKTAAARPAACDWLQHVRWRHVNGPTDPMKTDGVAVLMPGILSGAMAYDVLARNVIREAARRGRYVEVWGLDRRGNCLEDLTGVKAYAQSGDLSDVLDYYWRGKEIGGQRFAGFDRNNRILRDIGMAQTVRDYYAVLVNELPSQAWREQHVLCGGHSLGGPITQIFAGWDFDGSIKTNDDAGYRQCAGFVGFESTLDLDPTNDSPLLKGLIGAAFLGQYDFARKAGLSAIRSGLLNARLNLNGADPRSAIFMEAAAVGALQRPTGDATTLLRGIPFEQTIYDYFRFAGSPNLSSLLAGKDSLRRYRYTNMGLLGQLFDDNGSPFSAVRASLGFFDGAPVRRNVLGAQIGKIPVIDWAFQSNQMYLPQVPRASTPLMGWKNYDEVGRPGQPGYRSTTPGTEVTDARDFARLIHEGPTNFFEPYFPMRVVTDLTSWYGSDRGGELSSFMYPRPTRRKPRMQSLGGSGVAHKAKLGSPDPFVMNPGYEHVDSITASERQNNGRPEGSSKMVVDMFERVVPR